MENINVLLIVNPCSGQSKKRKTVDEITAEFPAEYNITPIETKCRGDATNIVKEYAENNDIVVCCGGDGTFNETINGVMQLPKRIPIGYIPTGSTNDLANTIGIPTELKAAVENIVAGKTNSYDIGLFNNRFFSYVASFGAAASLSYSTPQKLKNMLGHAAYLLDGLFLRLIPTLKNVKPLHAVIEYDGGKMEDDFYFGAISNSTSVGGIFKFKKDDVKLNDGKFEVLLVRGLKNPLEAFGLLGKIIKQNYDGEKIIFFNSTTVKIKFTDPHPFTLDGEYGGEHKDIHFSILNKAIDIISPENSMFNNN